MTLTATKTVPLWVFGAKGMLAGELLRLVESHPQLSLEGAVSRSRGELGHPHCSPGVATCSVEQAEDKIAERLSAGERAACVLALPHGESSAALGRLRARLGPRLEELHLVDLAADFRLRDAQRYARAYGHAHPAPEELFGFAYGLPELHREEIRGARRVAAAGCFATALQLATAPAAGLLDVARPWIYSGVTGSSGSGNEPKPGTHHPHRHGNLWAYGLEGHRHEAELEQCLRRRGSSEPLPQIHFVPHSGPFARGIHLTAALPLAEPLTSGEARELYALAYEGEPFVEVLTGRVPDLRSVAGSNRAQIGLAVRGQVLTVLCTLDNLVKGGSGQALQCLNLMLGLPETAGLPRAGLGVC